jgi:hypothetical protein
MKKILLLCSLYAGGLAAQNPQDALRNSWFAINGTARNMATGGVMGSLGGDITANQVNPAGLGLFKTGEFVISPQMMLNSNRFNFRGTDNKNKKNAFTMGASGFIWGTPHKKGSRWTSSAFSLSFNQLASFNNRTTYRGFNNVSSFSEQYLEELVRDGADTLAALSNYIYGSSLAFRTYLIDTISGPGGSVTGYQSLVPISTGINQYNDVTTRGGFNEISLGFAGNIEDKLYVGGSINIPFSSYRRELLYREEDATNNTNNDFNYFQYNEHFKSFGIGVNARVGFIYKPKEYIRLGLALHTPSFMTFKDQIRSSMETDTEGYAGKQIENSNNLNSGNAGERRYHLLTPWKAIASASYVFREVNDTRRQRAFISADIEYVNYRGSRFSAYDAGDLTAQAYYKQLNNITKETYRGNINIRLGGELKFNTWMVRLGGAFYGNPYQEKDQLKANRTIASGGLGYRNKGFFIDLTYSHQFNRDVNFPYLLNDKPNTFAIQRANAGGIILSFGIKF